MALITAREAAIKCTFMFELEIRYETKFISPRKALTHTLNSVFCERNVLVLGEVRPDADDEDEEGDDEAEHRHLEAHTVVVGPAVATVGRTAKFSHSEK